MESTEAELYRLKTNVKELQIELDSVSAQNTRLSEENDKLRSANTRLTRDANVACSVNIELKMQLFKVESERDDLNSSFEGLKKRYNKLHDSYLEKKRTSQAVQDYMQRQKRITSTTTTAEARNSNVKTEEAVKFRQTVPPTSNDQLSELQNKLKDAYDVIDELEFELESVTILEQDNERLRNKLKQLSVNDDIQLRDDVTSAAATSSTISDSGRFSGSLRLSTDSGIGERRRTFNRTSALLKTTSNQQQINDDGMKKLSSKNTLNSGNGNSGMQSLLGELQNFKFRSSANRKSQPDE